MKLKSHLIGYDRTRNDKVHKIEKQLVSIERKILDLTDEKKNIIELYAKGQFDHKSYGKKCNQYDVEISSAKVVRNELLSTVPTLHKKNVVDESIDRYCSALKNRLGKCMDFAPKRQLLLDYVRNVLAAQFEKQRSFRAEQNRRARKER